MTAAHSERSQIRDMVIKFVYLGFFLHLSGVTAWEWRTGLCTAMGPVLIIYRSFRYLCWTNCTYPWISGHTRFTHSPWWNQGPGKSSVDSVYFE